MARLHLLEALAMREQSFGPEHVDVAECLEGLGRVSRALGEHSEALSYFGRALAIRERSLPPEDARLQSLVQEVIEYQRSEGYELDAHRLESRAEEHSA